MDQMNYAENTEQASELKRHKNKTKKKKSNWKTALIALLLLILWGVGAVGGYVLSSMYIAPKVEEPPVSDDPDAEMMTRMKGSYNILAVGKDKVGLNTDTIMVAHIDTENDVLNILSVPRDTMSNVKRYVKKINAAYGVGGGKGNIDNLKKELTMLLGIQIDRYVVVNLDAFEQAIDAMGGVTIDVPQDMKYKDPYQDLMINISKGPQTLNGNQAVGFVRFRHGYANGDLGRIEAQQLFIEALINQCKSPSIVNKIPELAAIVKENMDTDMTVQEIIWFAKQGLEIDMSTGVHMYVLPGEAKMVYTGRQWLSYYIPHKTEVLNLVNERFNPYETPITADMLDVVDINSLKTKGSGTTTTTNNNSTNNSTTTTAPKDDTTSELKEENNASTSADDTSSGNHNTATPAEGDNTSGGNQTPAENNSGNTTDNSSSSSDKTEHITDEKGNIYEVDKESGKILNVTPAPEESN